MHRFALPALCLALSACQPIPQEAPSPGSPGPVDLVKCGGDLVEPLIGHRCDGDRCAIQVGVTEDRVEAHAAPAAPAPDADTRPINKRPACQQLTNRVRLLDGCQYPDLAMNQLPPCSAAWDVGSLVVDARDNKTLLSEHPVP